MNRTRRMPLQPAPFRHTLWTGAALWTLLLVAVLPATASAQSLAQLAEHVANDHPRIRLMRAQARAAQFDVQQVAGANGLRVGAFAESPRARFGANQTSTTSSADVGMRASYPVYDWGKADAEIGQARARLDAVQARVESEVLTQWTKLSETYIEVLRNQHATAVTQDYVDALQLLHSQVSEIVRVDPGRGVDLVQVESRLQQARLQALQRNTAGAEALVQLRALTNLPDTVVQALASLADIVPSVPETVMTRVEQHPAVLDASRQIAEAEQGVQLARALEKPQFELQVTAGSRDPFGRFKAFHMGDVRVVSQWEFYNGGGAQAKSAGAFERLLATKEQAQAIRRDLAAELVRALPRQQQLRDRAALWKQQIAFMRQLRHAYWEQFRLGRRSLLDLLSVENDIYQARLSETTERHDLLQSEYRLFIQLGYAAERWMSSGARAKVN